MSFCTPQTNSITCFIPILFATVAFIFGSSGGINCRTVEFYKTGGAIGPTEIDGGIFGYKTKGYYANEDNVWIVEICRSYTDIEDDFGFSYDVDRKTEVVQNLVIAIFVIGAIMLIGACVAPCFPCHPMLWKVYALSFLVLSALQGVTLLVLSSSLCLNNPLFQYLDFIQSPGADQYTEECEWGMGFRMLITATVFWFLAGASALVFSPPAEGDSSPAGLPASEREAVEEQAKAGGDEAAEGKPEEAVEASEEKPEETGE